MNEPTFLTDSEKQEAQEMREESRALAAAEAGNLLPAPVIAQPAWRMKIAKALAAAGLIGKKYEDSAKSKLAELAEHRIVIDRHGELLSEIELAKERCEQLRQQSGEILKSNEEVAEKLADQLRLGFGGIGGQNLIHFIQNCAVYSGALWYSANREAVAAKFKEWTLDNAVKQLREFEAENKVVLKQYGLI